MERIVKSNLKLMLSTEPGGMQLLISRESMGGYVGQWRKYPCVAARFNYDSETGGIVYFGNIQDLPQNIRNLNLASGSFRIAINPAPYPEYNFLQRIWHKFFSYRVDSDYIIGYIPDDGEISDRAMNNLEQTIVNYNTLYGFNL